jgi:hypothetical protein
MPQKNDDAQVNLALLAIKNDASLTLRRAAAIYGVHHTKLSRRIRGKQSRRDQAANSKKLTNLEESIIIQYILNLDSKGFPPRLRGVEDMANHILVDCDAPRFKLR